MEDMARLALIEQSVKNNDTYKKILCELLRYIYQVLDDSQDTELRTIESDLLKSAMEHQTFVDYLLYVGFLPVEKNYAYPKEQTLSKLKIAEAAIKRKLHFCYGPLMNDSHIPIKSNPSLPRAKKPSFKPVHVLRTQNPFLQKLEILFNDVIKYEDEELQQLARDQIPIVTLQLMAIDRIREQQKKIKTGEIKGHDLSFDIALLMELLGWFKYKFFKWVDKPECELCGGPTDFTNTITTVTDSEECRVELYKCQKCRGTAQFPRYNDVRTLLTSRRGRCGEWANCFALLCRALGYDTRYVYDTTDHVWCEVFDYERKSWLHVDPCEATLDAPLLYSHGWGKRLQYVVAVAADDIQDVTWRYTTQHKQVLERRRLCDEWSLIQSILSLREARQSQVSEARRRYLIKRGLDELVQLMLERQPADYESHGRISGSKQWRFERGELGTGAVENSHTFEFTQVGSYAIRYFTSSDKYVVRCEGREVETLTSWRAGVFAAKNVFRKIETDWRKVYLAREEGESTGSVSWKVSVRGNRLHFKSLCIRLVSAIYENGQMDWTVTFDGKDTIATKLGETPQRFDREFNEAVISGELSGGLGEIGWQHAQLFRQSLEDTHCTMEILAVVENIQNCL